MSVREVLRNGIRNSIGHQMKHPVQHARACQPPFSSVFRTLVRCPLPQRGQVPRPVLRCWDAVGCGRCDGGVCTEGTGGRGEVEGKGGGGVGAA